MENHVTLHHFLLFLKYLNEPVLGRLREIKCTFSYLSRDESDD